MSELIPASIQNDMKALNGIMNNAVNDQSITTEIATYRDFEYGGIKLAFDSPNSLTLEELEYDDSLFFTLAEKVHIFTSHLFDNTYTLTSWVMLEGLEEEEFKCVYDFDTAKGLPPSIYQAYAYLCAGLDYTLENRLEVFCAMTSSLPLNNWEFFNDYDGDEGTMGCYFDVEKALAHDMQTLQPAL